MREDGRFVVRAFRTTVGVMERTMGRLSSLGPCKVAKATTGRAGGHVHLSPEDECPIRHSLTLPNRTAKKPSK